MGDGPRHTHSSTAARALGAAAVLLCCALIVGACAAPAPADATDDDRDHARLRIENARLARRAVELEARLADARRAQRKPIDQPVVRSWLERRDTADGAPGFELCVEYFAHGEGANLLPTSLGRLCRELVLPDVTTTSAAIAAFLASEDFKCWSLAATNQPLPACWRK